MDEADQLGDRIGILHHGVLQCCGSSLFLKSRFGVGYTLTLSKHSSSGMNVMPAEEQARDHAFQNLVTSRVPDSQLLSNAGTELSFRLPLNQSARFPALLRDLDDAVAKPGSSSSSSDPSKPSGLASFGLSVTTMEDVFIRVAHQADEDDVSAQSLTQQKNSFDEQKICLLPDTGLVRLEDFSPSIFRQFLALLAKRFHVSRRDLRGWICQVGEFQSLFDFVLYLRSVFTSFLPCFCILAFCSVLCADCSVGHRFDSDAHKRRHRLHRDSDVCCRLQLAVAGSSHIQFVR